ncbi:MAG: peptide chain release factor 2, partial [Lachnospiraceae bacterium]|nr:peptide chain release factor 2 [Lachnospiraceae bacterium]
MKQQLLSYKEPLREVRGALDLENKSNRIQELEREMEAPDFWNDANSS